MRKPNLQVFGLLALLTLLFYLPILSNPSLFLERGNDLQEQFWPIFYFVKQQILQHQVFPLWINLFFSGTPLLPDPQSPLFYPPNAVFLFLPVGAAFVVSFFLHTLLGGIGTYLAAKLGFGFSRAASLFTASLYLATPRLAGYLEAGHFGLVASLAWLPLVLLATIRLIKSASARWSILLAVSLAGLFFTHLLTLLLTLGALTVFWVGALAGKQVKNWRKSASFLILALVLTFGLTAVTLLPQLEWQGHTTRYLLLETRDVYPKWTSVGEFIQAILWPWGKVQTLDTEKWLALGSITSFLALVGFWLFKRKTKLVLLTGAVLALTIALNNISPLYPFLLRQDWYVLFRVATRVWFIPILIVTFLGGFALEFLFKKNRRLAMLLAFLAVAELLVLSWLRIAKPITQDSQLAPTEVYQFLEKDEDRFRVFCTNRCLSQKEAARSSLELVEGYNTFQQINYFKHSWQLMGGYWNYYTLAIPAIGAYKFGELQPDARSLGEYNTKYVISSYELMDENFVLEEKFDKYLVYRNKAFLPRAYFRDGTEAPILRYSPNHIRVDTSGEYPTLILAEVYSPGWKAYLNGQDEIPVQQTPEALRLVDVSTHTKFVDFRYQPKSFRLGGFITGLTILLLAGIAVKKR